MSDREQLSDRSIWPGQVWLCTEHLEDSSAPCSCGLTPYVPRADADRLRAENERLRGRLAKIADKAKYLAEPAWTLEGCALVGQQIYREATSPPAFDEEQAIVFCKCRWEASELIERHPDCPHHGLASREDSPHA